MPPSLLQIAHCDSDLTIGEDARSSSEAVAPDLTADAPARV
jgi:hypothetical protein